MKWQESVEKASHYLALGSEQIVLPYYEAKPWKHVVEMTCDARRSFLGPVNFEATVGGLTFLWNQGFEDLDHESGKSVYERTPRKDEPPQQEALQTALLELPLPYADRLRSLIRERSAYLEAEATKFLKHAKYLLSLVEV